MSRSNAALRGFTLVEELSVIIVLGLILTAVVATIGPLMRSQNQTQAKVDTVQAAAMALYRVERDLRNTTAPIFACTTGSTPVCATPSPALTSTAAIVITSAYHAGTGQFQFAAGSGKPNWQGATVYWVDSSGSLNIAFDPHPAGFSVGNALTSSQAASAVSDALAAGGVTIARFVEQMSLAGPAVGNTVTFQMQAKSSVSGALNETTYQTDVETRNHP